MADLRFGLISEICHLKLYIPPQLPLDPPVLMGFLATPTAFVPGLLMNLEACAAFFEPAAPALPAFLLFTGNPI